MKKALFTIGIVALVATVVSCHNPQQIQEGERLPAPRNLTRVAGFTTVPDGATNHNWVVIHWDAANNLINPSFTLYRRRDGGSPQAIPTGWGGPSPTIGRGMLEHNAAAVGAIPAGWRRVTAGHNNLRFSAAFIVSDEDLAMWRGTTEFGVRTTGGEVIGTTVLHHEFGSNIVWGGTVDFTGPGAGQ